MTKEELRSLINECKDERIVAALWELYDIKFKNASEVHHSLFYNPMWWNKDSEFTRK